MQSNVNQRVNEDGGPWYTQFWAWFVFTPLIVVVIACSITVTIAFKGKEDVVTDDYYKVGKMINQAFQPTDYARELDLIGQLSIEGSVTTSEAGFLRVVLNETEWLPQESLVLSLSHPAQAEKDHFLTLIQVDTLTWQASLKNELSGRWYLRLSSLTDEGEEEWRIQGEIHLADALSTQLQ